MQMRCAHASGHPGHQYFTPCSHQAGLETVKPMAIPPSTRNHIKLSTRGSPSSLGETPCRSDSSLDDPSGGVSQHPLNADDRLPKAPGANPGSAMIGGGITIARTQMFILLRRGRYCSRLRWSRRGPRVRTQEKGGSRVPKPPTLKVSEASHLSI